MSKPVRNMTDPESRAFWEKLEERAEAFDRWAPDWLKSEALMPLNKEAVDATRREEG